VRWIFALLFEYCKATRPGNQPSFSVTAMWSVSSVAVEGMVIGAFAPSGQQTTPSMSKANIE
jgi:hypothetical protein